MHDIPEEAVKAAVVAMNTGDMVSYDSLSARQSADARRILTAALHFLPVQGAVNIDEIVQPLEDIHAPGGLCRWTDVATAIGEVRRALSALEPSATRELALEEIIALCRDYGEDSQPDSEYRLACNDIIEAIQERRTLSSPDHADAGKVEGDGWLPISSAPKDGTAVLVHFIPNEVPSLKPLICAAYWQKSDGLMKPGFWRVFHSVGPSFKATHWRPLPTPPSGEVA